MLNIGKKNRNTILLLLPLLLGFAFQATQYARAPIDYNFYTVYAKNADISLRPGNDLSSNGLTLLQNSTEQGYYALSLGKWGPGYMVNYTDAFRVVNREAFSIKMIGFNFTAGATGNTYLRIRLQNDTNDDGVGETWVTVWDGSATTLTTTNYIYLKEAATYGTTDGGVAKVSVDLVIPSTGIGLSNGTPQITYSGVLDMWFTSITF
ncbi:MAG: hypothetical protein V1850_04805 [Candidatus Bathyarchaeota archaeon]